MSWGNPDILGFVLVISNLTPAIRIPPSAQAPPRAALGLSGHIWPMGPPPPAAAPGDPSLSSCSVSLCPGAAFWPGATCSTCPAALPTGPETPCLARPTLLWLGGGRWLPAARPHLPAWAVGELEEGAVLLLLLDNISFKSCRLKPERRHFEPNGQKSVIFHCDFSASAGWISSW